VSLAFVLSGYSQPGNAPFANRYLSNLRSPTAVNVSLLPWKNNEINLGSTSKNWKNFYLEGSIYKGSDRFLSSDNSGNTFLGISTGKVNTGTENTAIGDSVMYSNTTGVRNTATGYQALFSNTTGMWNDAFGYQALFNNTTGIWNGAFGYHALFSNTEGYGNFAFGTQALEFNTTGYFNCAFGGRALWVNTTGNWNIANGVGTLASNTEGSYNVGYGGTALNLNSTGNGNTAVGDGAMWINTVNNDNTAIGNNAGAFSPNYSNLSLDYSNATFLGAFTNSDSGLVNITAVGFGAQAKKSNQVIVGNTEVTSIGGYANWSNFSDGRYKRNIKADVPGIEFIKQLRPVTYTLDVDGIENTKKEINLEKLKAINFPGLNGKIPFSANAVIKAKKIQSPEELKAKQEKSKVVYTGFIAQEVEQAAKKLNYDFSGVDAPKNKQDFYALRYGDFVVPLVKAVQEQQKQIDEQQKQIEELKALVLSITKQPASNPPGYSSAFLKQNVPNPFNKSTVISYYIPDNASHAQVLVTDMKGRLIKTFIATKGEGQINIGNGVLPAATYNYTLFLNGKKIDTKQMVITK